MNARDIQRRLIVERYTRSTVCPNFTPRHWFECDVCEITKAGYFVEYEIKLSRADFAADAKKEMRSWVDGDCVTINKHKAIASKLGPSRFYFVCPENLIGDFELPSWAGLIYAHERRGVRSPYNITLRTVRAATVLRRAKREELRAQIETSCYYRFMKIFVHT